MEAAKPEPLPQAGDVKHDVKQTGRSFLLADLARAVGAAYPSEHANTVIDAVTTDSRKMAQNSLFVALRGERFDGHVFIDTAVEAGAIAVVVDMESNMNAIPSHPNVPKLVVKDTHHAYGSIARLARRRIGRPVLAITGSNGKTTTKELLAAALNAQAPVHKTEANENNEIGAPKTLLAWPPDAWAAVIEMAMRAPGEIAELTEIAEPDVGVITNVSEVHLQGVGTIEDVARAKCELLAGLGPTATAIINADDPRIVAASRVVLQNQRIFRFGSSEDCDVRLVCAKQDDDGLRVTLSFKGEVLEATLPLVGKHNGLNAAAAAATAVAIGVPPETIMRGMKNVKVPGARLRVLRNVGVGLNVIDDTYNANPASMRAAFSALQDLAGTNRRVALLGDMLELGTSAPQLHYEVGMSAAESGVHVVYAAGPLAERTAAGAGDGGAAAYPFPDAESMKTALQDALSPGTWVLVKGSRGMRMEHLVEWMAKERKS